MLYYYIDGVPGYGGRVVPLTVTTSTSLNNYIFFSQTVGQPIKFPQSMQLVKWSYELRSMSNELKVFFFLNGIDGTIIQVEARRVLQIE